MEDWKVRLVEEYKQLLERMEKLSTALSKEEFYEKVGRVSAFLYSISVHWNGEFIRRLLKDRLKDLGIKVE